MSIKDKAYRLFSYISQVYSIDLPVIRNVTDHKAELWWQADLIHSEQCKIKEFDAECDTSEEETGNALGSEAWLSVTKRQYSQPPDLPEVIKDWINLSLTPYKNPSPKPSLQKIIPFEADKERPAAFEKYKKAWEEWRKSKEVQMPAIPDVLKEWLKDSMSDDEDLAIIPERIFEERFEDIPARVSALVSYISGQWKLWSERVLPLFKANALYDDLFSLHQRLSVEGDRTEIVWGHVFLTWKHSEGNTVYSPLIFTPINLVFDPNRRQISLTPSQTIPTKVDIDCLQDLEYPSKDDLIKFTLKPNNNDLPLDVWRHNQMRGFASTFTGLISNKPAERTNLYEDELTSKPPILNYPVVYNAPVIFVRERMRRLWVDDAKKIAEAIYKNSDIPPFIKSLIADPHSNELPNPEDYAKQDDIIIDEDGGELLLPKEYNAQQEEVVKKLRNHFGALVQGPPGTGKSHTIANIVSSLLAQGKRVLVTSQTENALGVLRDQIPPEIQTLCVSQLGNDTEAKKQLDKAVDAIGKRYTEKNSKVTEQRIKHIRDELRHIREEQAILRNQIKEWVELDTSTILIDNESVSAVQAAKECSENEKDHAWLPDSIKEDTKPPLNEEELLGMCSLLKEISSEDRKSCAQYLPLPESILSVEQFSEKILRWKSLSALSSEAEDLRCGWNEILYQLQHSDIQNAVSKLEEALLSLREVTSAWQQQILEFIILQDRQNEYWNSFLDKCHSYRESAWQAFQLSHGYAIEIIQNLPDDIDIEAALDELKRRNPTSFFNGLLLSKQAKQLYQSVKVDGHFLTTEERINAVRAYFSYHNYLRKIKTIWGQAIQTVNGTDLTLTGSMPLAEFDDGIKRLCCPIDWKKNYFEDIRNTLVSLGCCQQGLYKQDILEGSMKVLNCRLAEIEKKDIEKDLTEYHQLFTREASKDGAHILWSQFASAVMGKDVENYQETYNELARLIKLSNKTKQLEQLTGRLKTVAVLWCASLEKKAQDIGQAALEIDWKIAWRWRRLNEWLKRLHNRESVESLQDRLKRARKKEKELIVELVKERAWQRVKVEDRHYRALGAWANAMRRYGKTGGKYGYRWLAAAAKAMVDAVGAVPAWIMPLHRVVQSFPCESSIFDVVIIDEASQCDLRALPVLFRAKKILVVGDPEQISPSNVGIDREKIFALMQQLLFDIPNKEIFYIDNSLYDITQSLPRMNRTLLTEHFRCVPQIIEFNNHLCPSYAGKLEPLRQPNPKEMLNPPIVTVFLNNGFKNDNDINEPEAEALVEMIVKCCKDERYARGGKDNKKRTMGVISLLGEKQAKYISDLIAQYIDEKEREERKIICGDAYAFQGDERDVMFLSMVIAPNAPFSALSSSVDSHRQRFNVATSRARDQVFLFHSVRLDDIRNPACVRYKLLNWYMNPPLAEMEAGIEVLRKKADSPFEIEVGERLIKRGYKVIPQFQPLPNDRQYRIDLVVQGENNRLAVECDGDRHHGPEKWEYDQRREAQLRRAGWKFWRVSGSTFYRNKEKSLESLWQRLEAEGIEPALLTRPSGSNTYTTANIKNEPTAEDITQKPIDETEKKDSSVSKSVPFTLTPQEIHPHILERKKIPPFSFNWRVWLKISEWGKETMKINDFWWGFALEISNKLKQNSKLTEKDKKDMKQCWEQAVKKGFNPDI